MKKHNLPVILLRDLALLPYNVLRLEFENNNDNNVIDVSLLFHDGYLLVSSQIKDNISNVGVLSKIENKIELPNGNTRVDIRGIRRVKVNKYINIDRPSEPLESIISDFEIEKVDEKEEINLVNKIIKELKDYTNNIPYVSNSIINVIKNETKLDKIVDLIVFSIFSKEKIIEYLDIINPLERAYKLLEDIYNDKESFQIEKNIDSKIKKEMDSLQKEYFLKQKMKFIKEELGDSDSKSIEIDKLRNRVKKLNCNQKIKDRLNSEINRYEILPSSSLEVNMVREYIEWLLNLPWNKHTKDNNDLNYAKEILNKTHYGLEDVKTRIIEYLAVKKQTNSFKGSILCLVGPPGTGKTSIAKSIAEALGRKFVRISVNGIKDEAEIIGHRKTYIGANPGRIIQTMKKAGVSNPVFLIDEIDKMSTDYKSDPANTLLNILDREQNQFFSDNYIEEDYDLSNVLFILTANNIEDINGPLKDRLEIIKLSGYTEFEKADITKRYLIDSVLKENGIRNIKFSDNAISKIINNYTKEAGVRELRRQIDKIIRKIVTDINLKNKKITKLNITEKNVEKYLGIPKYSYNKILNKEVGIVNGLAYTVYGGDILPIEVNYYKGTGNLILTGSLGEVMKESASIAFSYIKANHKKFNIKYDLLVDNDIHIHVPEGAIKKEGPSAGIALTLVLVSLFNNIKIDSTLALTGEITLRGKVLPIGGLKEKSIGGLRSGIRTIIIPKDNVKDLDDIPLEVKNKIEFIPVSSFEEVFEFIKK